MSKLNINKEKIKELQNQGDIKIENPHVRVVDYLKQRNKDNGSVIAGEYFGAKYTYDETFKMINDYKKAFLSLDGINDKPITISAPSIISSVNAFYGGIDANKPVIPIGPGFLNAFPEIYMKNLNSQTLVVLDSFLNEDLINKLAKIGVKNVIVTSISDYMHPMVKEIAIKKGMIPQDNFLDTYIKSGKKFPQGMQFIKLEDFAKEGSKIEKDTNFSYEENKIGAYFLTGATTSRIPKCVPLYADGLVKMAEIYKKTWFDFKPGDRNTIFIPLFYATGAVHGVHAGLFSGLTNIYKPKYDRFAFASDLLETKPNLVLVAPSHLSTLEHAGLEDNQLDHLKYIFIGGEAVNPAQMKKYRETAKRLGIKYILNGYGMTETGSMSGISDKIALSDDDVTIVPVPGVKYRIIDPVTGEELPDNQRGILQKLSPCVTPGYTDETLNKKLFTEDGWINTGDVAIRYSDGHYRVFGRSTDYFTNNCQKYAMFDIEEDMLKHPGILEAEVIKFTISDQEYPAIVVVLGPEWTDKIPEILKYISKINKPGMQYLLGTRFVDKFKTNPITSKRDYLSLTDDLVGYYKYDKDTDTIYQIDIGDPINCYPISNNDLTIHEDEKDKILIKK